MKHKKKIILRVEDMSIDEWISWKKSVQRTTGKVMIKPQRNKQIITKKRKNYLDQERLTNWTSDSITTRRPYGGVGIKMSWNLYVQIATYIGTSLRAGSTVTFDSLLELDTVENDLKGVRDITTYIFFVRLDLEARGCLALARSQNRKSMFLKLTASGEKELSGLRLFPKQ